MGSVLCTSVSVTELKILQSYFKVRLEDSKSRNLYPYFKTKDRSSSEEPVFPDHFNEWNQQATGFKYIEHGHDSD